MIDYLIALIQQEQVDMSEYSRDWLQGLLRAESLGEPLAVVGAFSKIRGLLRGSMPIAALRPRGIGGIGYSPTCVIPVTGGAILEKVFRR